MKRLKTPRREWARLGAKVGMVAGVFAILMTFVGVRRVDSDELAPDLKEGDLVFYARFAPVEAGEVGVIDGDVRRAETSTGAPGKVLWTMRIRNI
ncbi:hypothetical protein J6X09_00070 [Candidatus Saccharibacteria bacterium]|nr:hypothetical protein [Candidatus Saccharibacteria bacterium]